MSAPVQRLDWVSLTGLAFALLVFKAWLTYRAGIELHYDEAQYWEWSRRLDWGYYSKGPLIAWLIALAEFLFGHGEWQIRLFAWLAHCLFLILVFRFALDLNGDRITAWWALLITLTTPVYFILGLAMTTDVLLFVFWTWGLWAAFRALFRDQPRAWYELGAAVGLGALTKLSVGLLALVVGLYVILHPRHRFHLRTPQPWIGLLILLACMSPVLLWNAQHDWVMFRHELGHIGHQEWSLVRPLMFLAGQWVALSPIVIIFALPIFFRVPTTSEGRFLWLTALIWLAFFLIKAAHAKVQPNWPAPIYIGILLLFADQIRHGSRRKQLSVCYGMATAMGLVALSLFPSIIGLGVHQDPFKDTKYWRSTIAKIHRETGNVEFLLTHAYQLAGELAFYWPEEIPVYLTGRADRRFNQHDLWPGIEREKGKTGLYISTSAALPPQLIKAFDTCRPVTVAKARSPKGKVLRSLYVSKCRHYHPVHWPKPSHY